MHILKHNWSAIGAQRLEQPPGTHCRRADFAARPAQARPAGQRRHAGTKHGLSSAAWPMRTKSKAPRHAHSLSLCHAAASAPAGDGGQRPVSPAHDSSQQRRRRRTHARPPVLSSTTPTKFPSSRHPAAGQRKSLKSSRSWHSPSSRPTCPRSACGASTGGCPAPCSMANMAKTCWFAIATCCPPATRASASTAFPLTSTTAITRRRATVLPATTIPTPTSRQSPTPTSTTHTTPTHWPGLPAPTCRACPVPTPTAATRERH